MSDAPAEVITAGPPPRRRRPTGGWLLLGAGLAAIAAGGVLFLTMNRDAKPKDKPEAPVKVEAVGPLKPFTATDAHFKASFPTPPKRTEQKVPAGSAPLRLVQYSSEWSSDTGYTVGWFQLAQAPAETGMRTFLEATRAGSVSAIRGTLLSSEFITVGGRQAVEYLASIPGGHFVKSRTLVVGRSVYVLQVVSASKTPPRYQEFVDSFSVLPGA
jgi:hypothetical protein